MGSRVNYKASAGFCSKIFHFRHSVPASLWVLSRSCRYPVRICFRTVLTLVPQNRTRCWNNHVTSDRVGTDDSNLQSGRRSARHLATFKLTTVTPAIYPLFSLPQPRCASTCLPEADRRGACTLRAKFPMGTVTISLIPSCAVFMCWRGVRPSRERENYPRHSTRASRSTLFYVCDRVKSDLRCCG